jgi:hypothetical protein
MPLNMFVYPVNPAANLPEAFTQIRPDRPPTRQPRPRRQPRSLDRSLDRAVIRKVVR